MKSASKVMKWMGAFFALLFVSMAWARGNGPTTAPPPELAARLAPLQQGLKLAGLSDNLPGLFVGLINDVIEGEIRPRKIQYQAPSTVVLSDVVVFAPGTKAVAKVEEVRATVSLSSLLRGNIVIETLHLGRPRLLLELVDGKLNLLEAFALKPTSTVTEDEEKSDPPDIEIRIDEFTFSGGGLRFRDHKNATITADDATGNGRVEIEVATGKVLVVVDKLQVGSGEIKLKELDLQYEKVAVQRIQFFENRLDLEGVKANVQGAEVRLRGRIHVLDDGELNLVGHANVPTGTWPDRLAAPPFPMPNAEVGFLVQGAFANPLVSLDVHTSSFEAFEYGIHQVDAKIRITPATVFLDDIVAKLSRNGDKKGAGTSSSKASSSGALKVSGDLRIKDLLLNVKVALLKVPLAAALVPAKIEPSPTGNLTGSVQILGIVDGKHPLRIQADVFAHHAKAFSLSFGKKLAIQSLLSVEPREIQVRSTSLTSSAKWSAQVRGKVGLEKKKLHLHVGAKVTRPEVFVEGLPKEMKIGPLQYNGEVKGPFDDVTVDGLVEIASVVGWGNALQDVQARLEVTPKRLILDQLAGRFSGGQIAGSVRVRLDKKSLPLDVKVEIPRINLHRLRNPDGKLLGLSGRANLQVEVAGPAKNPLTKIDLLAENVGVQKENLGTVKAVLRVDKTELVVDELSSNSPLLSMSSHEVRLLFEDMALQGWVQIKSIDLAELENAKSAKLGGALDGAVFLCGTAAAPRIEANLQMHELTTDNIALGTGPIEVFLSPSFTAQQPMLKCTDRGNVRNSGTASSKKDVAATTLMVQVASVLQGKTGRFQLESAYLLDEERLNARVSFANVEMLPWTIKMEPDVAALDGIAEGTLLVYGKLGKLDGQAELNVANVTAQPIEIESNEETNFSLHIAKELARFSTRGALHIQAKLKKGILNAALCAFPTSGQLKVAGKRCTKKERIWAEVQGPLHQKNKSFALDVNFGVHEERLQDFVRSLQTSETYASLTASGKLRVLFDGKETSKVRASGSILLLDQKIKAKSAPLATLRLPTQIRLFEDHTVELLSPLRYQVGDSDVVVNGIFGPKEMNAKVDGVIALATLTLLPGTFSQASGTATAHLEMKGAYSALRLDGSIEPMAGSQLTPRALQKRVVFEKGKLVFSSNPKDVFSQRIESDDLTVRIDDGSATLDGNVQVKILEDQDQDFIVENWDLLLVGSGLRFRSGTSRIETAMNLSLRGPHSKPVLKGQLEVTDGKVTESFSMKNFVIESAPSEPSKPLVETLALASLENLHFDVDIDVRSFHAQANVASFLLEADLTGAVRLEDSARLYSVVGAIEASRGSFQFPYANFELTQTRVEFPRGSNGIEPRVYILAAADLDPARTGFASETECVLELAGDTNRMALGLEAADAERSLTDTELLKFVLFGFPLAQQGDADPDAAVRAVSGELTAAFTNEVESAIARELGADLKFNVFAESDRVATGVKYQVGQRIDFEGETGIGVANGSDTYIRMRLLIFDHLPSPLPFRELAVGGEIEASSGGASTRKQAGSGNLRLSLRFFEQ